MNFVANFIRFQAVQKLWKSVRIWQSYGELKGGNFFETQCIFDVAYKAKTVKLKLVSLL